MEEKHHKMVQKVQMVQMNVLSFQKSQEDDMLVAAAVEAVYIVIMAQRAKAELVEHLVAEKVVHHNIFKEIREKEQKVETEKQILAAAAVVVEVVIRNLNSQVAPVALA